MQGTNELFKAGDIVVTDFPGITGIKRRPAVVLSSDTFHATHADVIIGLITSHLGAAHTPSDYVLADWAEAGLKLPSAFRAFLVTMPSEAITARIGRLSDHDWESVRSSARSALALFPS
ncbi:MAG: type II toxin-antitoxin system PemK/MazF family toxin [Candidatus Hydrogenedentes bacterium]|nr:type II toxin-antitoxin system PemK/MazF family toxin [Candidatus Hydrogenedentota bacterium]